MSRSSFEHLQDSRKHHIDKVSHQHLSSNPENGNPRSLISCLELRELGNDDSDHQSPSTSTNDSGLASDRSSSEGSSTKFSDSDMKSPTSGDQDQKGLTEFAENREAGSCGGPGKEEAEELKTDYQEGRPIKFHLPPLLFPRPFLELHPPSRRSSGQEEYLRELRGLDISSDEDEAMDSVSATWLSRRTTIVTGIVYL
eukprot:sb/3470772/